MAVSYSGPVEERKKRLKKGGKEETFLLYASVETDINLNQILLLLVISDTLPCGRLPQLNLQYIPFTC